MIWYCEKCKKHHANDELCPFIARQLKALPGLIVDAANFTVIAGQYGLITSQALDSVANKVNQIAGTTFSYEGTHQFIRDIQVFRRLNAEPFSRSGHFASPEAAKEYFDVVKESAEMKPSVMSSFESKLTGYEQEVDWLREKQGQLSSLYEKSYLLNNNAPGIDGETINRFTGETINRTTVKASINPLNRNSTAIKDAHEAIEKGYVTEQDVLNAPRGAENAARSAGLRNPVEELNSSESIRESNIRLEDKIEHGKAYTNVTAQEAAKKMAQGAVIGAAVALTVSGITNYIRYRNGEISKKEAFRDVAENGVRGALVGGAMAGVSILLPAGTIGFVAGVAIGLYIGTVCKNVLDEIFGKGAFGTILNSSGYISGMAMNLAEYAKRFVALDEKIQNNFKKICAKQKSIDYMFDEFNKTKEF